MSTTNEELVNKSLVKHWAGSVAEEAGLQRGDVIVEINREPVKDINGYERERSKLKKGESVLLLIKRQEATIFMTIEPS